jgi:Flp pilus assembly pilin Flp
LANVSSESGVTTIEYALIAALIFLVVVVAVRGIGVEVAVPYDTIGRELSN